MHQLQVRKKRIVLKISGEAFGGKNGIGLDANMIFHVAHQIQKLRKKNIRIVVVIGGGNIFRGIKSRKFHIDPVQGDYIGMESTVINILMLSEVLSFLGVKNYACSALGKNKVIDGYDKKKALSLLNRGYVILCAGGTGHPKVSTDSAAALRAYELSCDIILKATKVDGVYADDPMKNKKAKKYDALTFYEVLRKNLKVMDREAFLIANKHHIPIFVFNLFAKDSILRAVSRHPVGTIIH